MLQWILVGLFVAALIGSGYISMRKTRTIDDFFLGNRGVGPWMSAFAFGTTYFSAVIFIGYAGKVGWGFGASALWVAIGNTLVGCLLSWYVLARRTRAMTGRLQSRTMPEFLEARYNSPGLKIFSALIIFIFLVPYSASVYMGLSYLFQEVLGVDYMVANIAMAMLTALFLIMGGYLAVALTDFIQGIVMIFGVAMMLFYVFSHPNVGGVSEMLTRLAAIDPSLAAPVGKPGLIPLLSLVVLTSLGTWGLPQMVQKFYSIKDEASVHRATIIATLFSLVISIGAYGIGSTTHLFFDQLPLMNGQPNPDMLIPQILTMTLPMVGVTIILLLVLSASMSTLSSLVLVSSSAIAVDFMGIINPSFVKKGGIGLTRVLCLVFVLLSLGLALAKPTFILNLMAISWGTVAGTFLAPYLYGLFWKGVTRHGAWAGAIIGVSVSIGLSILGPLFGINKLFGVTLDAPLIGSLAMIVPLAAVPIVSVLTPALDPKTVSRAFGEPKEDTMQIHTRGKEISV